MGQTGAAKAPPTQPTGYDVKHLEMIQSVITRMGTNSFSVKNWTVALASAALALATREGLVGVLLASAVIVVFWGLDGYYLMQERRYRRLFDAVRNGADIAPFDMSTSRIAKKHEWFSACLSRTVLSLYVVMVLIVIVMTAYFLHKMRFVFRGVTL